MAEHAMSVLLVDDDDVSTESVVRGLEFHNVRLPAVIARDGRDALAVLRGEDAARAIHTPLLILLDLNMPGMSGLEFLGALRADENLHHHVVFVLTTSDSEYDRTAAYDKHVAGYIVKSPLDRHHSRLVRLLEQYRETVTLGP